MSPLLSILVLTFIGSIAGLIGGVLFLFSKRWASVLCANAVPFAAGVLLTVALLDLLPEAVETSGDTAYIVVLISLLGAFFFEQFFTHLHHHDDRSHTMSKTAVPLVLAGDTIHNFIDGVAIAAAFLVQPAFGVVVAISTFLHETPHEIADFGILISSGWSKKKAFIANALSASTSFLGALVVFFFAQHIENAIGIMLAIAAGLFLYLGASDFLPEIEEQGSGTWRKFLIIIAGVVLMAAVIEFTPGHG